MRMPIRDPRLRVRHVPVYLRPETLAAIRQDLQPTEDMMKALDAYHEEYRVLCLRFAERDGYGAPVIEQDGIKLRDDAKPYFRALEQKYSAVLRRFVQGTEALPRLEGIPTRTLSAAGQGETRPWVAVFVDYPEAPVVEHEPLLGALPDPDLLSL